MTDGQDARLQQLVAEDVDARRFYLQYVFLFGRLRWDHVRPIPREGLGRKAVARRSPRSPVLGFLNELGDRVDLRHHQARFWTFVGVVFLMFVGTFYLFVGSGFRGGDKAVATVTRSVEVKQTSVARLVWASPETRWPEGFRIPQPGFFMVTTRDYEILSGTLWIRYRTGAEVTIEGPAKFRMVDVNAAGLDLGRLHAKVPKEKKEAEGFAVHTPQTIVTDLGTEFAVAVDRHGTSDVYCTTGRIECVPTAGLEEGKKIILRAGESITVTPTGNIEKARPDPALASDTHRPSALLRPRGLVANAYHRVWDARGKRLAEDDRELAFRVATDGVFGRGENNEGPRSSFDTRGAGNASKTDFVGLTYERPVRIDRIKVFMGHQFGDGDGGSWRELPRVFILKNAVDPGSGPPESDPANWRELTPGRVIYGEAFSAKPHRNPSEVVEFALSSYPEKQRTGYGWAIGGVQGDGPAGYVSVTELRAYGVEWEKNKQK